MTDIVYLTGIMPTVTYHADLVWTDPEDFAIHFTQICQPRAMLSPGNEKLSLRRQDLTPVHAYWVAWSENGLAFGLNVFRYRRDRLRIVLAEYSGQVYAERLEAWLLMGWGKDGVIRLSNDSAPTEVLPPTKPGRPMTKCNDWARQQFEAGKAPRDIVEEYSERYAREKPENTTAPDKALRDLHRRWRGTMTNNG